MQRKNNLLKRNGFAMVLAIGVLVVLATIMALSYALSTTTTKRVVDSYIKKQAELYAKNSAEYILFKISQAANNCQPDDALITYTLDNIYDVEINVDYAYSNENCTDNNGDDNNYVSLTNATSDAAEYAYVKIDVTVVVNNGSINSEPIRIFRRYIEDISDYIH